MVVTLINMGLVDNLLTIWLRAWSISFVIAFPTIVVVAPLVKKLVDVVIEQ
tara:strand:- start:27075 stop:27227 length:153 start_codon:yes stop_codon:yes gene_type:complete